MFLTFADVFSTIILIVFFICFVFVCIALVRTMLFKNDRIRVLNRTSLSSEKIYEYQKNMSYLFANEMVEALTQIFPECFSNGEIKKINDSYLYVYRSNNIDAESLLINIPITKFDKNEIEVTAQGAMGENVYNSKTQLYCVFDALENVFLQEEKPNINLNIAIYEKEKTNADIVGYLLEKQEKINLILGEGGKILDPITSGFRSYYALIGVGINEQVVIRYKTKKIGKGKERIEDFVSDITSKEMFEMKLEKEIYPAVIRIAKDMTFGNRFILNNITLFPKLGKRIIEEEFTEINKAWLTRYEVDSIKEDENNYYVDIKFYLSMSEDSSTIVNAFENYVVKYGLEYVMLSEEEKSDKVSFHSPIYKFVKSLVDECFSDLYTSSYIMNDDVYDRESQKIGGNIIRFVPLYYSRDALIAMKTGSEEITFSSMDKATRFYEEMIIQFGGKQWKNKIQIIKKA